MTCAGCGHQNRQDAKFCTECGAALTSACPACGAATELGEKFCANCGAALARTTPTGPPGPSPEAASVAGEKKQITVLFADVAGSMDLQERLDAEVWAQIMGRFVSLLAEGVRRFGGTVDKFTGDGIMALFGAPVAQEDHARRACHAAWHLMKAIGEYSEELRREQGVELQVRLGLNSGDVVVGRVGDDVMLDPTALGHTVGLAQRMETLAEPGRAYLAERTARLVDGWFSLADLGPQVVKGSHEQVRVYVLEGPSPSPPVLHGGGLGVAPLVGRERELAVLEHALAMAGEGHAQVVGVVGEAGVGKSRLCDEFANGVAALGIVVRRAVGLSHGRDVPLLPILALLRDYFAITEADTAVQAREKISRRVLGVDPAADQVLPLLYDFLEVADPAHPAPQVAPEVRMRGIFEALRRLTQHRSEREVLVLVVEDLHWFDPQSEMFLEHLIESFPGSRTLVVTNFRPEFAARWMRHSYYRQLPLAPLEDTAVRELLGGLLGGDLSLAPLLGFVQERTSGNPFFVEEIVRALVEDGTLVGESGSYRLTRPLHEVEVPPSVQAVLAARIDRLLPEHKTVLQTAAVIGRTFDIAVLAEVNGSTDDALDNALSELCAAELLQKAGHHPTVEYRFWHPLTQEVTYGSLLREHHQRLHAAVAQALMARAGDRLDEMAAVLAWHWERASRPLEAARWNMRAGQWALRSDLGEAQRRWRATIELLATVDEKPEALELAIRARGRLIQFGARTGMAPEESDRLFGEGRALAERLGDTALLAGLMFYSGAPKTFAGDFTGGRAAYIEAIRLAAGDPELTAAAGMALVYGFSFTGPLEEGLHWVDRTLSLCAGDPELGTSLTGYSIVGRTRLHASWMLARAGRLPDAATSLEEALGLLRQRGQPDALAWALAGLPILAWLTGEAEDWSSSASEAVALGQDTGNVPSLVIALEALGLAHLTKQRPERAVAAFEQALAEARRHGSARFEDANVLCHLARAHHAAGDLPKAVAAAEEAVELARRQGARVVGCLALLTRAQGRRAIGKSLAAQGDLADALIIAQETGALTYEAFIHEELGRLHKDEKQLFEALRLYRQIGAIGHARRLEVELSTRAAQ